MTQIKGIEEKKKRVLNAKDAKDARWRNFTTKGHRADEPQPEELSRRGTENAEKIRG